MLFRVVVICIFATACRKDDVRPPNIVLVSIDTLRFDATSLGARSTNTTPTLAQLAKDGLNFTRCYSTTDSTPPSHFSMLTGYVYGIDTEIDRTELSLPSLLRGRGYRAFGVAANGNLSPRFMRSLMAFGSFVNLVDARHEAHVATNPADDRTLERYQHVLNDWNRETVSANADAALAHFLPQLSGSQPFFGFINLLDAHDPYVPDARFYDLTQERVPAGDLRYRAVATDFREHQKTLAIAQGRPWSTSFDLPDGAIATYHDRYRAEVRQVDAALGKLVNELRARKLMDDTVLIVTSDHGEAFGEENLMTHSFNNGGAREATHHVPLVIVLPRAYGVAGREVRQLCTIADIPATIYQLLDIDPQTVWESTIPGNFGRSLLPLAGTPALTGVATRVPLSPLDEETRQRQNDEAKERLRSLGYLH